jgi:pimeloyl-ACP methyl ester carboxylesterase
MRFALFSLISVIVSCSSAATSKSSLVLVHGAHFDDRSWDLIKKEWHSPRVYSLSLFDRSEDPKTLNLNIYAQRLCDFIKKKGQVVLLGHSQGGAVINQAYGLCPKNIKSLVYVGATIPFPKEKAFDLLETRDDEYYFSAISENKDKALFEIKNQDFFAEGFANDATENEKTSILKMVRDEPAEASKTKLSFDLESYQTLKKYVVLTKDDRIITFETQRKYADRLQNTEFFEIQSGHLPMISKPRDLVSITSNILGEN